MIRIEEIPPIEVSKSVDSFSQNPQIREAVSRSVFNDDEVLVEISTKGAFFVLDYYSDKDEKNKVTIFFDEKGIPREVFYYRSASNAENYKEAVYFCGKIDTSSDDVNQQVLNKLDELKTELAFANNKENFADALSTTTFPERSFISFKSIVPRLQYYLRTNSELERSLKDFFEVDDVNDLLFTLVPCEKSKTIVLISISEQNDPYLALLIDQKRNILCMSFSKGEANFIELNMNPEKNVYNSEVENLLMAFSLVNDLSAMR